MLQEPERDGLNNVIEFLHRLAAAHGFDLTLLVIADLTTIETTVTHLRKLLDSN